MGGILDLPLIQFMGAVLELLLYGWSLSHARECATWLTSGDIGVYVVLFAGTMWVLRKRRRGADASAVSPVIEVCSWFMFVVLSIVSSHAPCLSFEEYCVDRVTLALRGHHLLHIPWVPRPRDKSTRPVDLPRRFGVKDQSRPRGDVWALRRRHGDSAGVYFGFGRHWQAHSRLAGRSTGYG
jgi:hypothetical protein